MQEVEVKAMRSSEGRAEQEMGTLGAKALRQVAACGV